jgi:hypothetical protein
MKPTVKSILLDFLHSQIQLGRNELKSHMIERDLVWYGKAYWGVVHNPSTYSRAWRKVKEKGKIPEIDVIDIKIINTKPEVTWILKTVV